MFINENFCWEITRTDTYGVLLVDVETPDDYARTEVPAFKWLTSFGKYERLQITFPDGGPDDVAILKSTSDCILDGHLADDQDVDVALNGCPGSMTFEVKYKTETCNWNA